MALEKKDEIISIAEEWQENLLNSLDDKDRQELFNLCLKIMEGTKNYL